MFHHPNDTVFRELGYMLIEVGGQHRVSVQMFSIGDEQAPAVDAISGE